MPSLLNRDYLSGVDAAWLRMEDPTNLMMITGLYLVDKPFDVDRLLDVLDSRMLKFRRFRQRVHQPTFGLPYWEDDPHFDLRNHIRRVALPAPGGEAELQELVSDLMSTGLDFSRPLWQMHVVDNYDGGGALIGRIHHSVGDGIALMYVLLAMTDFSAEGLHPDTQGEQQAQRSSNPVEMILSRASGALQVAATARKLTEKALREGITSVMGPSEAFDLAMQGTGIAVTGAVSLAKIALRAPDTKTMFKGKLGVRKRAAWTSPIPLDEIKAIGKVTGGTVNDVLLTATAGALRRFMEKRGENTRGLTIRATVPVNLRPLDTMGELGNKFGLVFLSLPIGIIDPVERLKALKRNMDRLKESPEALLVLGLLNTFGMGPEEVQDLAVRFFASKATAVMTNVPGPRIPLFLGGSGIKGMMFWVPQSGKLGLGVSIFSYNNTVRMGIAVDEGLAGDPQDITDELHVELAEMKKLVSQLADAAAKGRVDEQGITEAAAKGRVDEQGMKEAAAKGRVEEQGMKEAAAKGRVDEQGMTDAAANGQGREQGMTVEEVMTPPAPAGDDLKKIKGIGPKTADLLREQGVSTFAQVADMDVARLKKLVAAGGSRFRVIDPATWPEQAAALRDA